MFNPFHIGTYLFTWLNGTLVGVDEFGNKYYTEKTPTLHHKRRRWVLFNGCREASKVPPEWHGWLHYTFDAPLKKEGQPDWVKPHKPNLAGTALAYTPGQSRKGPKKLVKAGDYTPWNPS